MQQRLGRKPASGWASDWRPGEGKAVFTRSVVSGMPLHASVEFDPTTWSTGPLSQLVPLINCNTKVNFQWNCELWILKPCFIFFLSCWSEELISQSRESLISWRERKVMFTQLPLVFYTQEPVVQLHASVIWCPTIRRRAADSETSVFCYLL